MDEIGGPISIGGINFQVKWNTETKLVSAQKEGTQPWMNFNDWQALSLEDALTEAEAMLVSNGQALP